MKDDSSIANIVIKYLEDNNYDGLYLPGECACKLDNLFPCDQVDLWCQGGYLQEGDAEFDFYIGPE